MIQVHWIHIPMINYGSTHFRCGYIKRKTIYKQHNRTLNTYFVIFVDVIPTCIYMSDYALYIGINQSFLNLILSRYDFNCIRFNAIHAYSGVRNRKLNFCS
jgi:hypothetical protein